MILNIICNSVIHSINIFCLQLFTVLILNNSLLLKTFVTLLFISLLRQFMNTFHRKDLGGIIRVIHIYGKKLAIYYFLSFKLLLILRRTLLSPFPAS